jgi:hypothetical protein
MNVSSYIETEMNKVYTENGALSNAGTGSKVLDFFALGGAIRNIEPTKALNVFKYAYNENVLLTLKTMFYFRDIRGGQGQRKAFRDQLVLIEYVNPGILRRNLGNVVEFGRWDDLFVLLDTTLRDDVINFVEAQLMQDLQDFDNGRPISILAKWMKSENTSSKESRRLAGILRKGLGLTSSEYRRLLSMLRRALNVVETHMAHNEWAKIDYSSVPSQAMLKYRKAFYRKDSDRFSKYIEQVKSGEKKINAGTLYPQQIVHEILRGKTENVDVLWDALPDYISNREEKSIAVVDTSGSMCGTPLEVALSLGIYLAEKTQGFYHNKFITFSARPEMQTIKGNNIVEKVENLSNVDWDMNTNVEKVFLTILDAAIKNKVQVTDMVDKLYIISDMEFDSADSSTDKTLFKHIFEEYKAYGYTMPKLVFWNVDARNVQFPMQMNDAGVQLVSGYSPSIFKALMKGDTLSPYEMMLDVINSERYASVVV